MSHRRFLIALALLVSLMPTSLAANMANPIRQGSPAGEPTGSLDSIRILRENLLIDMRPVARREPAIVEARYAIRNEGEGRLVELVFVASAMTRGGENITIDSRGKMMPNAMPPSPEASWEIRLDDRPVLGMYSDSIPIPSSWQAPRETPGIDGQALRYEVYHLDATISFAVELTPGEHTIRVRYNAMPTVQSRAISPAAFWQLAYVLAPARQWAGFGGLESRVLLPEGWSAAATPMMERRGDTLFGSWQSIPADALALTVRAPIPGQFFLIENRLPTIIAVALGLVLCAWGGRRLGRLLGKRGKGWLAGLPIFIILGALPAAGMVATMWLEEEWARSLMGNQMAHGHGYGYAIALLLLMPPTFLAGFGLALFFASRARKRIEESR